MPLRRLAILLTMLLALPSSGAVPVVYHSPADDGVDPGGAVQVPSLQPTTVHVYIDGGSAASAANPCFQGSGDEICAFDLTLTGQAGLSLVGFTPAGNVVANLVGNVLRANAVDALVGTLGPVKVGDLVVEGAEGGFLELDPGQSVDASLALVAIPQATLVTLPEPTPGLAWPAGIGALLLLGRRRRRTGP